MAAVRASKASDETIDEAGLACVDCTGVRGAWPGAEWWFLRNGGRRVGELGFSGYDITGKREWEQRWV